MSIGEYKKAESARLRETIVRWFIDNPAGLQQECAADLGLNINTVSKHVKAIRQERAAQRVDA